MSTKSSHDTGLDLQFATADEIARALGKRLRSERLSGLITQQELAVRAGVALGSIKQLEASGRVTLPTFVRIVQALSLGDELAQLLRQRAFTSIAELERAEQPARQRARRPTSKAER